MLHHRRLSPGRLTTGALTLAVALACRAHAQDAGDAAPPSRALLLELAAEYGCAAVLLFSDPADDGDARGPTCPDGPWKPDWAAQRLQSSWNDVSIRHLGS
ncbi:MAG: hypothetical protein ABI054_06655 [Planctomycetota bacterium]